MVVLARGIAVAFAMVASGCYEPALRDCTVTCHAPTDCADGQACGPDGLCVGPSAQACSAEGPDAAIPATTIKLHVTIDGKGAVVVDDNPALTCAASGPHGDCTFDVTSRSVHRLVATPDGNRGFTMWMGACAGTSTTCTLTPSGATTVGAKFGN